MVYNWSKTLKVQYEYDNILPYENGISGPKHSCIVGWTCWMELYEIILLCCVVFWLKYELFTL